MSKEYIVLRRLGSKSGGRQWLPGSRVKLDEAQGLTLTRRGYVQPAPEEAPTRQEQRRQRARKPKPDVLPPSAVVDAPESAPDMESKDHASNTD